MGISKRELLEEYYLNEITEVIRAYNRLHGGGGKTEEKQLDAMAFFGEGGEVIG